MRPVVMPSYGQTRSYSSQIEKDLHLLGLQKSFRAWVTCLGKSFVEEEFNQLKERLDAIKCGLESKETEKHKRTITEAFLVAEKRPASAPLNKAKSQKEKVVEMNLRLNMDFQAAGHEGSTKRQIFIKDLKQDLADASKTGASDFNILKLSPGSVIVEVTAPEKAAQEIHMQSLDPNSRLRNGKVTRFTDRISLPSSNLQVDERAEATKAKALGRTTDLLISGWSQKDALDYSQAPAKVHVSVAQEQAARRIEIRMLCPALLLLRQRVIGRMLWIKLARAWDCLVCTVKDRRRKGALSRKVLVNVVNRFVTAAFGRWAMHWKREKAFIFKGRRVIKRWALQTLVHVFVEWNEQARMQKVVSRMMRNFVRSRELKRRTATYMQWRSTIEEQIVIKGKLNNVVNRLEKSCLVKCLEAWHEHALAQFVMTGRLQKVVYRLKYNCLLKCCRLWKDNIEEGLEIEAKLKHALSSLCQRGLRIMFCCWIEYRAIKSKLKRTNLRLRQGGLCKTFFLWKDKIEEGIEIKAKLKQALARACQRGLRIMLCCWIEYRTIKSKLKRTHSRLRQGGLCKTFCLWKDKTEEGIAIKAKLKQALSRVCQRGLWIMFSCWMEHRTIESKLKRAQRMLHHMLRQKLAISFDYFVDCSKSAKRHRETVCRVLQRMKLRQLSCAYGCYSRAVAIALVQRRELASFMERWRIPLMNTSFFLWLEYKDAVILERAEEVGEKAWMIAITSRQILEKALEQQHRKADQEVARRTKMCKATVRRMLREQLARAFGLFVDCMLRAQRRREFQFNLCLIVKLLRRIVRRQLAVASGCYSIYFFTVFRGNLARIMAKSKTSHMKKAFRTWLEFWAEEVNEKERQISMVSRQHLQVAIEQQQLKADQDAARMNEMCNAMEQRILRQELARAFGSFVDCILTAQENRETVRKVLRRMMHQQLARAFGVFVDCIQMSKEKRETVSKTLHCMMRQQLARAFGVFVDCIQMAKENRETLRKVLHRMMHQQLARAFGFFVQGVQMAKENRETLRKVLHRIMHQQLARAFSFFVECILMAKKNRGTSREIVLSLMGKQRTLCVVKAFDMWLEYIDMVLHEREETEKEAEREAENQNSMLSRQHLQQAVEQACSRAVEASEMARMYVEMAEKLKLEVDTEKARRIRMSQGMVYRMILHKKSLAWNRFVIQVLHTKEQRQFVPKVVRIVNTIMRTLLVAFSRLSRYVKIQKRRSKVLHLFINRWSRVGLCMHFRCWRASTDTGRMVQQFEFLQELNNINNHRVPGDSSRQQQQQQQLPLHQLAERQQKGSDGHFAEGHVLQLVANLLGPRQTKQQLEQEKNELQHQQDMEKDLDFEVERRLKEKHLQSRTRTQTTSSSGSAAGHSTPKFDRLSSYLALESSKQSYPVFISPPPLPSNVQDKKNITEYKL